ncbi:DUF6106 family protein [Clostridium arbusti]|uniref:DUF6106 family protein n=1 Tax=Clostridium arbusti TaxID=1137848 RepID=UPI000287EA6C|nr:DUF6106 family protein [Clostridium arbusti]
MDVFYEQFVGRKDDKFYNFVKLSAYAAGIIALGFFSIAKIAGFVLFIIIAGVIFIVKRKLYAEYEYAFTNGEIDIDKITDKSNRKTVSNFHIRDIEVMAEKDSGIIKNSDFKYDKELNFYNKNNSNAVYSILLIYSGEKLKINFVPDKKFLELCFLMNNKKVII